MATCLLVSGDFVRTGGMDMANYALASYLARAGVSVHLVAHRVAPELASMNGVTVHRVVKPAGSYLLGSPLIDRVGRQWARRLAARGARVVVNGGNCGWGDINWVHYVHDAYVPVVATGGLRRLKERLARTYFTSTERRSITSARAIVVNSDRTRDDVLRAFNVDRGIVHTVYYGVDAARFGPISPDERESARAQLGIASDRPTMAFVGALGDRRKGFDVLFDAWRTLCQDARWDVDLVVVGAGAEVPRWTERAREAGLTGRVRFLGFTREVERVLAASDALVHPARYEAYGLGVHEALCRGLPALVSASAGVAERYPAPLRPLLIADPNDVAEVRRSLLWWYGNREVIRSEAGAFADALRADGWDAMAARIWTIVSGQRASLND